jgi:pimeloyl-ACP methyl ester carboxylesterase
METRRLLASLACVVALIGCNAGTPPPPASGPSISPMPSPPAQSASPLSTRRLDGTPMAPCALGATFALCGTLRVPEDRGAPEGRQIDLAVVVVPALDRDPAPDPLFALAGGPGDAATERFGWLPGTFTQVHRSRDIVLVDQRGTGGSNEIVLPDFPDTDGLTSAAAEARWSSWAKGVDALAADPRQYTSEVAAEDLDAVRAALSYDRIDLYGPSYGATLAQYELRQHPDHVRATVLDGGTPVDVPLFERVAANSQHALDVLFARCAADAACHAAFPHLDAEFRDVMARLSTHPLPKFTDPATGRTGTVTMDDIASGIHQALLDASTAAVLPLAIHLAARGDWAGAVAATGSAATETSTDNLLMSAEIRCSEAWARFDPAVVAATETRSYLTGVEVEGAEAWATICRHLPGGVVPPNDADPVRSTLPVLWVVGAADPQDPPPNLVDVAAELPNSRVVVAPGQGHTVGTVGCIANVIDAFIDAGTADRLDASCAPNAVPTATFAVP